MQLFQNGVKLGQKMKVNDGHAFYLDCFKKEKKSR